MDKSYRNPNDNWYYNRRYDMKSRESMKGCFYSLIGILILMIVSLLMSSCKTVYVPVETVKTEYQTVTVHDSIFTELIKHDSIVIAQKGDTVFVSRWHTLYKDRWRDKLITDTIIKIDSIQVPYPVERQLTTWEKTKMDMGGIAMLVLVVVLFIMLLKWLVKIKK